MACPVLNSVRSRLCCPRRSQARFRPRNPRVSPVLRRLASLPRSRRASRSHQCNQPQPLVATQCESFDAAIESTVGTAFDAAKWHAHCSTQFADFDADLVAVKRGSVHITFESARVAPTCSRRANRRRSHPCNRPQPLVVTQCESFDAVFKSTVGTASMQPSLHPIIQLSSPAVMLAN
jgi:hypothetical protein